MNMKHGLLFTIFCALLAGQSAMALEVDREVMPRITVGGRVIATADAFRVDDRAGVVDEDEINIADSSVLMRFDKRMYGGGVAGGVVGYKEHEGEVVLHQTYAFYWNRYFELQMGRTRLPNTLLEFPVARDEDLLDYAYVGNASSNEEFDQLYSKLLSVTWFVDRKNHRLNAWTGTRENDPDIADPLFANAPGGFDSYGGGYVYEQSEDLRYVKWIRHAGLLADVQKVETAGKEEWMGAAILGAEFNLVMNPVSNWSLGLQGVGNNGIDGAISLASTAERARAKYAAYVGMLRYTARPNLLTRWQAALTYAYKDYSDVVDATQTSIMPSLFYRIGQGVDLLAQVRRTRYGDGLGGGAETVSQLGIAFSLGASFNDNIGERNSILNLEHGYIQ